MKRIFINQTLSRTDQEVNIAGWVLTIRSHGKILFFDVRDKTGLLQVVFTPAMGEGYELAKKVRPEWVVSITGTVAKRPANMENPAVETGKLELQARILEVFSKAKTLPFGVDTPGHEIGEDTRMKYRYLDLRRPRMKRNLEMRDKIITFMRGFLQNEGFVEIETPIITKSTPEGARDFIVPSRMQPGKFYALPQSPQQYKQLLQIAGFERYFQVARCFRDEDPRADRQAEFTQLDIETSFMSQDEILELVERLYIQLVAKLFPKKKIQQIPFPRLNYSEVMQKYQSDKPDLRKVNNDPDELAFAYVVNFPMFEWRETEKRWDAVHHPFTRPQTEDIQKIKGKPGSVLAWQYDLVLNGYEIGGGSLRSYTPEVLEAVFEVMGHSKEQIRDKFGHLLEAFEYGVPPHGGMAPGIDRFVSIVLNEPNIREVIAFPKTGDGRDLMMNAPSEVDASQLKELHLSIGEKKTKGKKK